MNVFMLVVMTMISVEHPRPRSDERFQINEKGKLLLNGESIPIHINDISLGGARLREDELKQDILLKGQDVQLDIANLGRIPAEVIRFENGVVYLHFKDLKGKIRQELIQHLYTGKYQNSSELKYNNFVKQLFRRIFYDHSQLNAPSTKSK